MEGVLSQKGYEKAWEKKHLKLASLREFFKEENMPEGFSTVLSTLQVQHQNGFSPWELQITARDIVSQAATGSTEVLWGKIQCLCADQILFPCANGTYRLHDALKQKVLDYSQKSNPIQVYPVLV